MVTIVMLTRVVEDAKVYMDSKISHSSIISGYFISG